MQASVFKDYLSSPGANCLVDVSGFYNSSCLFKISVLVCLHTYQTGGGNRCLEMVWNLVII